MEALTIDEMRRAIAAIRPPAPDMDTPETRERVLVVLAQMVPNTPENPTRMMAEEHVIER